MDPSVSAQLFKVAIVGESLTGKTSIVRRLTRDSFEPEPNEEEHEIKRLQVEINGGKRLNVAIHDKIGFTASTSSHYQGANAVVVIYDISEMETFKLVNRWREEANRYTKGKPVIALLGCKSDLETRAVDTALAKEYAESHVMLWLGETSAKTGANVQDSFITLAQAMEEAAQKIAAEQAAAGTSSPKPSTTVNNGVKIVKGRGKNGGGGGGIRCLLL